jgi:IclR-like helix-turn-helix domain-containing protein
MDASKTRLGPRGVLIALTDVQVAQVLRETSGGASPVRLLAEVSDVDALRRVVRPLLEDEAFSRSTLRALLVLAAFPADGSERALTDVARQLGFFAGTTHRYVGTWMAVGLLEQNPRSRRYRRALGRGAGRARGRATGGDDAG